MAFSSVDGGRGGHAAPRSNGSLLGSVAGILTNQVAKGATGGPMKNGPSLQFAGSPTVTNIPREPVIPPYTPQPQPPPFNGVPAGFDIGSIGGSPPAQQQTPVQTLDFNSLLQQALSNLGYNQIDNGLTKARSQLIERYGDPALAGMAGFGVDPQAADFARQNYLSGNADLARLDKQRENNRQAVVNQLAAHGLLRSGGLGYGLNQAEQAYGNSRYDLTQSYLQQLSDLLNQALQQKSQLRQNVTNALISQFGQYATDPNQLIGLYGG